MNIPGIYHKSRIARLVENISYLDSSLIDCHRYTLIEITLIGFLRHRFCHYSTSVRYFAKHSPKNRDIYQRVIQPWLRKNDQPLREYLSGHLAR